MTNKQRMIAILAWWLLIFVWYVTYQERAIADGTKVRLQTSPVDPNDFFRGDYVILWYDISDACTALDESPNPQYDMTGREKMMWGKLVYVPLQLSGDVMVASWCLREKPDSWLYIKWIYERYRSTRYGIEKYFVQQGLWIELENAVGKMKVQVSISTSGQARIVWYTLE